MVSGALADVSREILLFLIFSAFGFASEDSRFLMGGSDVVNTWL